jgi:hypothetical protein
MKIINTICMLAISINPTGPDMPQLDLGNNNKIHKYIIMCCSIDISYQNVLTIDVTKSL